MPKPEAILLTRENIDKISQALGIDRKEVEAEYEVGLRNPETVYYVKNAFLYDAQVPYLIYGYRSFLDDFASVPPGIANNFVPVTQLKKSP